MRFLISAQSVDHPGIVSLVSGVIAERGWSIEDASMTRLAGRFAMLLVVSAADGSVNDVVASLKPTLDLFGVAFQVDEVDSETPEVVTGQKWTVTVYGSDRPGIVAAVTNVLAKLDVNIDDLSTRASDSTYTMLIDATVPEAVEAAEFKARLAEVGESLNVTCHATRVDIDVL